MDKDVAKRLLRDAGLDVAPFACLTRRSAALSPYEDLVARLGLPLFVKPANQGSSVGVSRVEDAQGLAQALDTAFQYDHKVLVESAIVGREIECAVLGNEAPQASVCGEVVVHDAFYAYGTKYISEDGADVLVPADLEGDTQTRIQQVALRAYQALECAGMARVDVFLTAQGRIVVNEINTLPGFTHISMYPKLWQASGLTYPQLVTRLIELALERHAADAALRSSVTLPA
jgi:D-alanine-D-alanine ligase